MKTMQSKPSHHCAAALLPLSFRGISLSVHPPCSCLLRRAPRLTGWKLQLALALLEQPWSAPLLNHSMRKSGIPQAVRELDMPEPATFQPHWPHPPAPQREEAVVEGSPAAQRLELAAQAIPGSAHKPHTPQSLLERTRPDLEATHFPGCDTLVV
jgi:hypothetical protein